MARYACAAQPWDVVGWATLTRPWRRSPQKREGGGHTGEDTRGQPQRGQTRPPTTTTTRSERDTHPPAGKTWAG